MSGFAIDVVLRTHNRAEMLEAALESLFAADRTGIALRLLLVDNASSDETPGLVARLAERPAPLLVPLHEEKPGGQHALNCAIAHASAPVIAFFDDDERVPPGCLQAIAREMDGTQTVFVTGPCRPLWEGAPPPQVQILAMAEGRMIAADAAHDVAPHHHRRMAQHLLVVVQRAQHALMRGGVFMARRQIFIAEFVHVLAPGAQHAMVRVPCQEGYLP